MGSVVVDLDRKEIKDILSKELNLKNTIIVLEEVNGEAFGGHLDSIVIKIIGEVDWESKEYD